MNTAKKEADTSKYKPKIAKTNYVSYMANDDILKEMRKDTQDSQENAMAAQVAKGLSQFKEEQEC